MVSVVTQFIYCKMLFIKLTRGTNKALDARLDIHARGFWERQRSAFFDVRVCHPNADSYKDLTPQQIYRQHENEKKRMYASRVMEVEQATFTPLVFTTTWGMAEECRRYHSKLAELKAIKKGEDYATTISWIRPKFPLPSWGQHFYALEAHEQQEESRWTFKTLTSK